MPARLGVPVGAKQQVGQVDMAHRIQGMVEDRFRIDPASGIDRAHIGEQCPEFIERAEIGGLPSQDVDEGLLGILPTVEGAQQNRALDLDIDSAGLLDGLAREPIVKLP